MTVARSVCGLLCAFSLIYVKPIVALGEEVPAEAATAHLHMLAAGTEIHLRLLEPAASHTHKRGDRFKLEVAQPVVIDEAIVVPAVGGHSCGETGHGAPKAGK